MPAPRPSQPVTLSGDIHLVPVVEFEPGPYAQQERPLPADSGEDDALGWQRYWEQSLADSGIHLEPLEPGSRLVPVSRLTDPHVLRELLRVKLRSVDVVAQEEILNQVIALDGGHALLDGKDVVLTPRCCSDLTNLRSWENAANLRCDGFWIGHPQVFAAWEEPWLVLREEEPDWHGVHREWHLPVEALAQALVTARKEQEDLARRLLPIVSERFPPELARSLAAKLTGLGDLLRESRE